MISLSLTRVLAALALLAGLLAGAPARAQAPQPEFFAKSLALVVGINEYQGRDFPPLANAVRDAELLAGVLRQQGFEVTLLTDRQANRSAIVNALVDLRRRAGRQDRVLVYFGGHGHTERSPSDPKTEMGYIIPHGATGPGDYIDIEELRTQARRLTEPRHILFVLNSCFGGAIGEKPTRGLRAETEQPRFIETIARMPVRKYMTAGTADQKVEDGPPGGYSPYLRHFVEGIRDGNADFNRDGFVTASELFSYMQPHVHNEMQSPQLNAMFGHGGGDFFFRVAAMAPVVAAAPAVGQATVQRAPAPQPQPAPAPVATPSVQPAPQAPAPARQRVVQRQTAPVDLEAARRPIDELFLAWEELNFGNYIAQWAPDATRSIRVRGQRVTEDVATIRAKRQRFFPQLASVDVIDYGLAVTRATPTEVTFSAYYRMVFNQKNGRVIRESEREMYRVRFSPQQNRWLIVENRDYLR
jgi:uncharacterized caspase-like protein